MRKLQKKISLLGDHDSEKKIEWINAGEICNWVKDISWHKNKLSTNE